MKSARKDPSPRVRTYLIAYNAFSAVAWSYVLLALIIHLFNLDGKSDTYRLVTNPSASAILSRWLPRVPLDSQLPAPFQPFYQRAQSAYLRVGVQTAFVQSFALLEVLHVILGWVRSPLPTTAAQVASRLFLVWGITEQFAPTRSFPLYTTMVFAWSAVEVIRYTFYTFALIGSSIRILLWLRYTAFYILYPLGASSEASLIYVTLPSSLPIQGLQHHTWKLTDFLRAALFVIWWPGLFVMYTYMIAQRRKVLGPQGHKIKAN